MSTFAVIPAAGMSVRMGRPKLSLPLGDKTVLEHVLEALQSAGIADVVVVIGPHSTELRALVKPPVHVLQLSEATADMRATIEKGLTWIEAQFQPTATDDWLLVPADHPTLDADVVKALLHARATAPASSIVVPTFNGQRGHPTLIGWKHVAGIRSLPAGWGLNTYLRTHADETREVAVESAAILADLDTPADYERLRRVWSANPSGG
jgi:molybdenum cofactor cytidylyltransferase